MWINKTHRKCSSLKAVSYRLKSRGSLTTEFVIALIFISFAFVATLHFSFRAVSREVGYYSAYVRARSDKLYSDGSKVKRRKCEDNPLWYISGEGECIQN